MADEKKSESSKSEPSTATSDSVPANYSRGENQKNVSQHYRDNWNLIFANSAKKTVVKSKAKVKAKPAKKSAAKKKR